jgi:hypothetical protein
LIARARPLPVHDPGLPAVPRARSAGSQDELSGSGVDLPQEVIDKENQPPVFLAILLRRRE